MLALIKAAQSGKVPGAEIAIVVSDKSTATGIESARALGVEAVVIERAGRTRVEHEDDIRRALLDHDINLICLAGFMRLLSPSFIAAFRGKILNIHPSLLPSFPGLDAQKQAIAHGVKVSGCTVHFVDDTLDGGPIIAQRTVPVMDSDSVESLSARILTEEHAVYTEALALVVSERFQIEGRRVVRR